MNGFGQENQLIPVQYPSGNRHRNLNDTPSGKTESQVVTEKSSSVVTERSSAFERG
jgi:hypothetical protein